MKIKIGNIFDSHCTTLVNTVNCVGVMGKGIALEFKKRYPAMFEDYRILCRQKKLKPGHPYLYSDLSGVSILNFPTKDHWKSPSKFSYIEEGLTWFRDNYQALGITSIAFPPLGCGNGGLRWEDVGPEMYQKLKDLPIEIEIYALFGTPKEELTSSYLEKTSQSDSHKEIGSRIPFNDRWLLILEVVRRVNNEKYALHVGRVIYQKICYVLTRSGIQAGFHFVKGSYGPFSKEVNDSIVALSNANLMIEKQEPYQSLLQTHVTENFVFDPSKYSQKELECLDKTVDLFCRIKNTAQAEMMATVMFSYDLLLKQKKAVTESDILKDILSWKSRWINNKEEEIKDTIINLAALGWIHPQMDLSKQNDAF